MLMMPRCSLGNCARALRLGLLSASAVVMAFSPVANAQENDLEACQETVEPDCFSH